MKPVWPRRFPRTALLVFLALASAVAVAAARAVPVGVVTAPVERGDVTHEAVGSGTLESETTVEIAFTIPGRIVEVRVEEGEWVREGEILAVLDAEQEAHRVAAAHRNVALARHGAERSVADVRRARATLDAARLESTRTERLFAVGAVPEAVLDDAREALARAEADLASAIAARQQQRSTVEVARAGLALDTSRSEETIVRSPFDGVVVRREAEVGDVVGARAAVLTVASTAKVWARTWIDETLIPQTYQGQPARVVIPGHRESSFRARVDRVAVEVDRSTHEVLVDLELLERPQRYAFGQRVDGIVELETREGVLRVARGACQETAGRCYRVERGRIAEVPVEFGMLGTRFAEVQSGLSPGDRLVPLPEDGARIPTGRRVRSEAP